MQEGKMVEIKSFVAGQWLEGEVVNDENPSNLKEPAALAHLADMSVAEKAVDAARSALDSWKKLPAPSRGEILLKAARLLEERAEEIGKDMALEEGKTVAEGIGETKRAANILKYYAGQTLEPDGEIYPSASPITFLFARREPVGVVLAISPWNFPIAIPGWKIAPALAYGNTVIWKPAEIVPLTSYHFLKALIDAGIPTGVLNMVIGKGSTVGDYLVEHPGVNAISFTGSNKVGRSILVKAAERNKKVQLEMGGKNPAIVFADADLDLAAEMVARGAFMSAGQKCTATSRVLVQREVVEKFIQKLTEKATTWPVGNALDPNTKVGPLASQEQYNKVKSYLDLAAEEGASFVAGRKMDAPDPGYFAPLTVLTDVSERSRLWREEIFGPVAIIRPFEDYEEAVNFANDTEFGLVSSVFTTNLKTAIRFSQDVQTGVVKVNQETAGLEYQVPFGGMKESSSGSREQGKVARDFYTQWKTVYVDLP